MKIWIQSFLIFALPLLYCDRLGCVNFCGHHNDSSFDDRSSPILMQYEPPRDPQNPSHSENHQNSQNLSGHSIAKEDTHFLSFIMPCYNCEKTVEESIESIFQQKLNIPFELICTDDGSTDRTYQLLLEMKKNHPEMKVLQHKKNQGGGPARNTCVKNSQGDLIFCLDSDNILANPNDIQDLIDFLDQEKVDVACFGILQFFEGNLNLTNHWEFSAPGGRYTAYDIVKTCNHPCASGNYLFTRKSFDAVGGYSDLYVLDTFCFGFEQACHGFPIAYLSDHCYLHRVSPNGYYARGQKAAVLDREFIDILLHHPELFTPHTLNFLKNAAKEGKFPNGWDYIYVTTSGLLQTRSF